MNQQKSAPPKLSIRNAQPSDQKLVSQLIFDTFPKMATFIFGLGDSQKAKVVLAALFFQPGHRFSFEFTRVVTYGAQVAGIFIAYPGKGLFSLNWHLARLLMKQYNLIEKTHIIHRGLPVIFIQEAASDEYLLSNLAVKNRQRGKGIGAQVLSYVEETARQAGYQKLSLMVTMDNPDARRFYERHGYKTISMHLESNRREKYLGPGYQRMVKELSL